MSNAAEQLQTAEGQLATAKDALAVARERFHKTPTMKAEEAVEEAERHVRRAERFRDARSVALEQANAAARLDEQGKAREQRAELLGKRGQVRGEIRERMADVSALYERLNGVVTALDTLVASDVALCRDYNALGAPAADERHKAAPLKIERVRLAFNALLGETWDDRPRGSPDIVPVLRAAQRLGEPGSSSDFLTRLEQVIAEADHAFGAAPLNRWLAALRPPANDDHTPPAERARDAIQLREQLKETRP